MKYFIGLLIILIGLLLSCRKAGDDSSSKQESTSEELKSKPSVGSLAVGGIPSEEDSEGLLELSEDEASESLGRLSTVQGALAIELSKEDQASLSLKGECEGTFFCFARAFTDIYDMVTKAAQCNFDLLATGNPEIHKVENYPIYYVDGFGTVGLGENGAFCPKKADVDQFKQDLKSGNHGDDDEFFLPTRLVVFKSKKNRIDWRLVFFPADFIDILSKFIPPIESLRNHDLDFYGFRGYHDFEDSEDNGEGNVVLDFDEITRMAETLNEAFDEKDSDDEGTPQGVIEISYDLASDPQSFITTFKNGFSFGDGDSPFSDDSPTKILRSSGENYLHFVSKQSFIGDDDENSDGTDPFSTVQFCNPDKYIKDVVKSQYLSDPSNTHMQIIWKDVPKGKNLPDEYIARIIQTKGGAFIYGDNIFEGAKNGAAELGLIRIKAPRCPEMSDTEMAMKGALRGGVYLNTDGFVNAKSESGFGGGETSDIQWISSQVAIADFPAFKKFKFIDPKVKDDTPLGKSGSAISVPDADLSNLDTSGICDVSDNLCYQFDDLSLQSLAIMHMMCPRTEDGGFSGTWAFAATCPTDGLTRTCLTTNFDYGDNTIESVLTHMYSDDELSSQNLCTAFGGTLSPALSASCDSSAFQNCHEFASVAPQVWGSLQSHCVKENEGGFNGTWDPASASCTDTGLIGTCTWNFNFGVNTPTVTKFYNSSFGGGTSQAYCESSLGGTWEAN